MTFPLEGGAQSAVRNPQSAIPEWQRWNDYGMALLLEGDKGSEKGELIQAAQAFEMVEKLGRADGPLNLARVYFKEGRLDDAVAALQRAVKFDPPAPRWTVAWLTGLVNKIRQLAEIMVLMDESIENGGAHRMLGHLNARVPRIPMFTWWVDRDLAISELRLSLQVAPHSLLSKIYLAEALLKFSPAGRQEALGLLQHIVASNPDPDRLVEDSRICDRHTRGDIRWPRSCSSSAPGQSAVTWAASCRAPGTT